jgi:DNA-binding MarR family transcriptional regulator
MSDMTRVAAVSDNFIALMRSFGRVRARLLSAAEHDVEWSAHIALKCIATEGPMRASALAETLQSDPSTVSRQVAALVRDGLVERRSDPGDGRASLLVLTDKADAVLADHDKIRLEYFARLLDGWSDADLRRFAELLLRFGQAYDAANEEWITDRIATRSAARTGSTN